MVRFVQHLRSLGAGKRPRSQAAVFDHGYAAIELPWDIGRPQPELIRLAQAGGIGGRVLDIGCGSGENVLYFCRQGLSASGLDLSQKAIAIARRKADERNLRATFMVGDALRLDRLRRTFDTVVDCGLFHVFTEQEKVQLVASVASVLNPNGTYVILTLDRENGPGPWPNGTGADDITDLFGDGWRLDFIRAARFETKFEAPQARAGLRAWIASSTKVLSA